MSPTLFQLIHIHLPRVVVLYVLPVRAYEVSLS